jgi:hypothetical protein
MFEREYGTTFDDAGKCVRQTPDAGYVFCGYTRGSGPADYNGYILRTDPWGDTLWTMVLGGPGYDAVYSLALTSDNGYLVCGTYFHPGSHSDCWLIRLNDGGDTLWTKSDYSSTNATVFAVQPVNGGDFILTGTRETAGGSGHMYLMKTNGSGDSLWTRTYAYWDASGGNAVITTADDGYLICGYIDQNIPMWNRNLGLVKVNSQGDTLWTRQFGSGAYEMGWSVCEAPAGGFLAAGYTTGFGATTGDIYLVKITLGGDMEWQTHFGNTGLDIAFDVAGTTDDEYILTGITAEEGSEIQEALLTKLDQNGDTLWWKTCGGIRKSFGNSVRQTSDDGYILCGSTEADGTGIYDVYLVKTNPDGSLTAMEEMQTGSPGLQLFPNPSSGKFAIRLPAGSIMFSINDGCGNAIRSEAVLSREVIPADLTCFSRGIYVVRVTTDQSVLSGKLILQ